VQDLRYAFRSLRKSPGFSITVVVVPALAIGANTAIFSAVEGVVLEPLPFRDPDRLMLVLLYNPTLKHATALSYPDFLDWHRNSRSFEQIAAFTDQDFDLTNPGAPEHVSGKEISANFFSTLGLKLTLGRELSPEEDRTAGPPAVVISDRLWQDRFDRRDVLRMMVGQGVRLALIGVAIGVFAAVVLAHALPGFSHLLYGVEATDPLTRVGTSFILIVTAVAASYVPARRASKMDPMSVLRND
jgi:putative ABC transport system permease protein